MSSWRELPLPDEAVKLASRIRGLAIRVHREVGPGFREHVYQQCMAFALRESGHKVDERVPLTVKFRGLTIPRAGEAELKARETTQPAHRAQVIGYLRATDLPIGLLFNFHAPRLIPGGSDWIVHPRYLEPGP